MIPKRVNIIVAVIFGALALALPPFLSHGSLTVFVNLILAAIVTTGLGVLMGYAGQVSLGQGAFFAIGALGTGLLATANVPPLIALVLGTLIAGLFAIIVGYSLLRLRGNYLAFGTLALQVIVLTVVANLSFFGGPGGIQGIPNLGIGNWAIDSPMGYAYVAIVALGLVLLASYRIVRSRFGRGLRALSGSETAAESSGVPVFGYKIQVFTHSAMVAALAGGIYAFFIGFVSASSFSIMMSFQYVVMAVVGGVTSLWGGVIGAALVVAVLQVLNTIGTQPGMPATAPAILSYAVYAVILIVTLLFIPKGVWPTLVDWLTTRTGWARRKAAEPILEGASPVDGGGRPEHRPDDARAARATSPDEAPIQNPIVTETRK